MNIHQWKQQIHKFNEAFADNQEVIDNWDRNIKANISKFSKENAIWNLDDLYTGEKEKAAILVGASPSLLEDVEKLKDINDDFFIMCANSALKVLLKHDIKPDYCICLDGDPIDIPQHLDCDNKDITLLATCIISPEALEKWKGPIYYQAYYNVDKEYKSKIRRTLGKAMLGGGNSISQALYICAILFDCRTIIFVGNEFCFDKDYYADSNIPKTETIAALFPIKDNKGRDRQTIPALYTYATWIDKTCRDLTPPGFFIDCSGGLLSTTSNAIHTMELSEAIENVKYAFEKKREVNAASSKKDKVNLILDIAKTNEISEENPDIYRYNFAEKREELWKIARMK